MLPAVNCAPAAAALAAILALGASACGETGARGSPSVDGVAEAIEGLEDALGARELGRVCEQILSPEARRRAGGEECASRLARTTGGVRSPRIELLSVTLGRGGAIARVRASNGEEPPAIDSVRLVPGEGGYRIDSLSSG